MRRWHAWCVIIAAASVAPSGCGSSKTVTHTFNSATERERAQVFAHAEAVRRARALFPKARLSVTSYHEFIGWTTKRFDSLLVVHSRSPSGASSQLGPWEVTVSINPKSGALTLVGIDEHLPRPPRAVASARTHHAAGNSSAVPSTYPGSPGSRSTSPSRSSLPIS